jgi:hypothetical protein
MEIYYNVQSGSDVNAFAHLSFFHYENVSTYQQLSLTEFHVQLHVEEVP